MIKCFILDDEQPSIDIVKGYIQKIPALELIGTSLNPIEGVELIRATKPDVVFLDIQMDEMNGIEVKQIIDPGIKVVFCTAYSEFAVTSYDLDAVDYLIKPIAFSRFVRAVQRISDKIILSIHAAEVIPHDYFYVKTEHKGKMVKIDLDDIDYIESRSNYASIQRGDNATLGYLSMKDLETKLPSSQFARIHKSYIVAINRIAAFENGSLLLKNHTVRIPIGDSYRENFMEKMKDKLI